MATLDIFVRFSAEGGKKQSQVEEQLDLYEVTCRAWAEQNGVQIGEVVRASDVSGAARVDTRALGMLIRRVEAGQSAGILTPSFDCFGRDEIEGCLAYKKIKQAGGRLVCVSDGADSDCDGDETIFEARVVFAENYLRSVNAIPGAHRPCAGAGRVPRRPAALWVRLSRRWPAYARPERETADPIPSEDPADLTFAIPSDESYPLVA